MDFKERYYKIKEKESDTNEERKRLEADFSKWLESQENWKEFIIAHIQKTDLDKTYIYNYLDSFVKNLRFFVNYLLFDIKVYGDSISYNHYVPIIIPEEHLLNIQDHLIIHKDIIKNEIRELEVDIECYKDDIEDLKKKIEEANKKIENLKKWLE